jgi:hypothetical protein
MDEFEKRQEDAAAAEAGSIGGRADEDEDPERRPVDEAGGGQAEGFEQAEEALEEQASHGEPGSSPTQEAFAPEEESDLETGAARGEADEIGSSERTGET